MTEASPVAKSTAIIAIRGRARADDENPLVF